MGLSRDFGGILFMFFLTHKEWPDKQKHINKCLPPTQSRDSPAHSFMFMCFLSLRTVIVATNAAETAVTS